MYKYKDDICVIPDEIKRMSEEELKTEIARIEQSSTPKSGSILIALPYHLKSALFLLLISTAAGFYNCAAQKIPVRHPNLDIVLRGFVVSIAMPPSFR